MSGEHHRSSSRPNSQSRVDPPIGFPLLGSGGLTAAPLDVIRRSFQDAMSWFKAKPQGDFTEGEFLAFVNAGKAVQSGDIDAAIDKLRQVDGEQEARRTRGIFRKTMALLRRRKRPTMVRMLLATLLNFRCVKRVNEATEHFNRETSNDIMERLRAMAPHPFRRGQEDVLAEILRQKGYEYQSIGMCEICASLAVGELRRNEGKSTKLCQRCVRNAQSILDEQAKHRRKVAKVIRKNHTELEEAVAIDPTNKPAQKNLQASQNLLKQISM